jgi:8-oxo-dGTP pyrophosphatase MutT (NUDIX family)
MSDVSPPGARRAARVILIDDQNRALFFQAQEPKSGNRFWVMPGGGLEAGETFEEAAYRETLEETGILVRVGPCVWIRRHQHIWNGKPADQFEKFFVARPISAEIEIAGQNLDGYITGHQWWSLDDLTASREEFAPQRVAELLESVLRGDFPKEPMDCGV